jgi:hypothetical protein
MTDADFRQKYAAKTEAATEQPVQKEEVTTVQPVAETEVKQESFVSTTPA